MQSKGGIKLLLSAIDVHMLQFTVHRMIENRLSVFTEQLYGSARGTDDVVLARHIAIYLTYLVGNFTYAAVGRVFERDRRMAAFAIGRIEAQREADLSFDRAMALFEAEVRRDWDNNRARLALAPV